jgi:hypothetical protein
MANIRATLVAFMAHRPELDQPLSREDLQRYAYKLASLAPSSVYAQYRRLHKDCSLNGERLPKASAIQLLVTTWRFLRARRYSPKVAVNGNCPSPAHKVLLTPRRATSVSHGHQDGAIHYFDIPALAGWR